MAKVQKEIRLVDPNAPELGYRVTFHYNDLQTFKRELMGITGTSYKPVPFKHWHVPAYQGNLAELVEFGERHGFVTEDAILKLVQSGAQTVDVTRRGDMIGTDLCLMFPRGDAALAPVQKLARRSFRRFPEDHWAVELRIENAPLIFEIVKTYDFKLTVSAKMHLSGLQALWNAQPHGLRVTVVEHNMLKIEIPNASPIEPAIRKITAARMVSRGVFMAPMFPATVERLIELAHSVGSPLDERTRTDLDVGLKEYHRMIALSYAESHDIAFEGIGGIPRPFQLAGVWYAVQAKRALICDQQGLGKTVQGAVWLHAIKGIPAVIFCPPSLVLNWKKELTKWLPMYSIGVLKGTKPKPGDYQQDIIICSYAIASARVQNGMKEAMAVRGVKAMVCDESHYLKNNALNKNKQYTTKRVQAVKEFSSDLEYRLLLTGTPISNRPIEFASQLDIVGRLDEFGGYTRFAREFGGAFRTAFGWQYGAVNPEKLHELNEILRSRCYVRRTKEEVLKELPNKQRTVIPMEIDNLAEYREAEANVVKYLVELVEQDKVFQESIAVYDEETQKQLIKDRKKDKEISTRSAEVLVRINTLKQLAVKGKIKACVDWVREFMESGEKLILFAHHIWVQKTFIHEFPHAARLIAEDSGETQEQQKARFMSDPTCLLIVCSDEVGKEGHTLTAASDVCFIELGWTPSGHEQCEDRAHRIGQTDSVTAWYLNSIKTIEEQIYELIESKRQTVNAATNGSLDTTKAPSMVNDLIKKLKEGVMLNEA